MKNEISDFVQNINHQFMDFVQNYDLSEDNLIRKVVHTFTVAENCFLIACKLGLDQNDRNLAYLCGILHDLGRFEQWTRFKTYDDNKSVDHGDVSYILADKFDLSMLSETEKEIVKLVIKHHTKPYRGDDSRVVLFISIILNADAFANVLNTANGSKIISAKEDGVTPEILQDFCDMKKLWIYSPRTKLDYVLILSACLYYVRFNFLKAQILEQNLIDVIEETFLPYLNQEDKKVYRSAISTLKERYFDLSYTKNIDK